MRLLLHQARVLTLMSSLEGFSDEPLKGERQSDSESTEDQSAFQEEWLPLHLDEYETEDIPLKMASHQDDASISDMTLAQMLSGLKTARAQDLDTRPYVKEIHHQVAFSFACLSFILVAIPLSLKTQRKETNISLGLALIVLLVYYSFFILGDALVETSDPALNLWILFWIPNFLFQLLGLYAIRRANRGIG